MKIRKARYDDLDAIKSIADANRAYVGFLPRVVFERAAQMRQLLVATVDGTIVGFVRYYHRRRDSQTTLHEICVLEQFRRQRVGTALLRELIEECLSLRRSSVRLKCPTDLEANQFYKQLGFERVGAERGKRKSLNVWVLRLDGVRNLTDFSCSKGSSAITNLVDAIGGPSKPVRSCYGRSTLHKPENSCDCSRAHRTRQ